ncbi:MAG: phosphoglycolate phosphatase [Rhizobiaceae bacterium]|mgnify:CR=1 FL=1
MSQPIAVFDLDGTLVDTAPDLIASLNHAIGNAGLAPIDEAALRAYSGHGGRALLARAFQLSGKHLTEAETARLHAIFLEHYTESMPGGSSLFDGGLDALEGLSKAGFLLAVCTNKPEHLALRLLDRLGHAPMFAAICGADTFPFKKPDPRHLVMTIEKAGGDRTRAVMVGDTETDIHAARAAGVPVVAVDFGYSARPVAEYEPSKVISHFAALTPALARRLIGENS